MYLKKLYAPRTNATDPPRVTGVRIMRAGNVQNVSPNWIDGGEAEGWLSRANGAITITGQLRDGTPKTLVYRIAERPGLYSCHNHERIADVGDWKTAQDYVAAHFAGVASPDSQNPSGYRQNNGFSLVLVEGGVVEDMTPEEARTMLQGVRETLETKLRAKYGNTREAAERRNAAKARVAQEG